MILLNVLQGRRTAPHHKELPGLNCQYWHCWKILLKANSAIKQFTEDWFPLFLLILKETFFFCVQKKNRKQKKNWSQSAMVNLSEILTLGSKTEHDSVSQVLFASARSPLSYHVTSQPQKKRWDIITESAEVASVRAFIWKFLPDYGPDISVPCGILMSLYEDPKKE